MKIDSKSPEVEAFGRFIPIISALLGGTDAMRAAGEAYLPKFKSEKADKEYGESDYQDRLGAATLTPYLEDTVKSMTGRVFHKPFVMELHESITQYEDDFDLSGKSISGVFESIFYEALAFSRSFIVVDYSMQSVASNRAEEIQSGARPYAFKVDIDQVLDVRYKDGKIVLFKYQHRVIDKEKTNDFEVEYVDEVVLMTPGRIRSWQRSEKEWVAIDDRDVLVGGKTLDYVMALELKLSRKPPLMNLAYLNVKHWQSQSSQDNITDEARVPILLITGADSSADVVYVSGGISLPKDGSMSYVEHSGAAIESGQKSLDKLEDQMAIAGAKLVTRTKMALTDTQAKSETAKEVSELMLYGMLFGDFMNKTIELFGLWLGINDPGFIDITENLKNTIDSDTQATDIIQAFNSNIISANTAFDALVAKGTIGDSRTFEEEQEQIAIENETGLSRPPSFPV